MPAYEPFMPRELEAGDFMGNKGGGIGGAGGDGGGGTVEPPGPGPGDANFYIDLLAQALGVPGLEVPGQRRRRMMGNTAMERTPIPAMPGGWGAGGGGGGSAMPAMPGGWGAAGGGRTAMPAMPGGGGGWNVPRYMWGTDIEQQQMLADVPAYKCGTPRYQNGAPAGTHPGGPAIVGEDGPELVDLPAGATVTPNPQTIARAIIHLLMGGEVPGYAYGTFERGGGSRMPQRGRIPNRRGEGGGTMPPPRAPQPGGQGGPAINPDGSWNRTGWSSSWPDFMNAIIQSGAAGGAFDPTGSKVAAEHARQQITKSAGARERAATLGAEIDSGGDPALAAYGRMMARLGTQGDAADAYGNALTQSALQNQRFLQGVVGGPIAGAATRRDPREPNPYAEIINGVTGIPLPGATGTSGSPSGSPAPQGQYANSGSMRNYWDQGRLL